MSDYPHLENFLAAYFHQDWQTEHAKPEGVIDYYRESESPAQVEAAAEDIARLLSHDHDEAALGAIAGGMGCEYDPTEDGATWRAWLQRLHDLLLGKG